jgi:beta-lactamase class A
LDLGLVRRREFLSIGAAALASPAWAQTAPMAAITDYEAASGGHIGLYAENIRTGARLTWRADERFVMCSTFKASLAACVLARVDHGQDHLDQAIAFGPADVPDWHAPIAKANLGKGALSVRQLCQAAVEQSDNTCATLLLARIGGPPALTAFWRGMGDRVTRLDDTEPLLNQTPLGGVRDTTTPASMAGILRQLVLGKVLAPPSRTLLTQWLVGCQTGDNRLRAGLPKTWTIGDKTGNNGQDAAGDIAVAWPRPDQPIVISVYTRGGRPTPAQLEAAFAEIGRLVGKRLTSAA